MVATVWSDANRGTRYDRRGGFRDNTREKRDRVEVRTNQQIPSKAEWRPWVSRVLSWGL